MTHKVSTILKRIELLLLVRQTSVLTVTLKDQEIADLCYTNSRSIVNVN